MTHAQDDQRPISVVLVDDQALVRDGFAMIIESQPDMVIVGSAENGAEAVEVVRREQPDVVLMDVRMPGLDGLAATRALLTSGTTSKVLMLTTFDLDEYVAEALALGASGFLLKDTPRGVLVEAIRRAVADELVLAPAVLNRMVTSFVRRGARRTDRRLDATHRARTGGPGAAGRGAQQCRGRRPDVSGTHHGEDLRRPAAGQDGPA